MLELLFVAAIVVVVMAAAIPQALAALNHSRGYAAARYVAALVVQTRLQAVSRSANVALRFEPGPRGYSIAAYQDGNRNGVRTKDIATGVDRRVEYPVRLYERFPGADIGLADGTPAASAVGFGASGLLSFSPHGTATSGTVYVRGRDGTQWAVRVLGATGRTRVLKYDRTSRAWVTTF